ncbi:histidine ammonia-lyase [Croceiramulus getboli]|nr:histidine ammonia-lyase [Flavobacteriaceae bacterium YJPT1-3]
MKTTSSHFAYGEDQLSCRLALKLARGTLQGTLSPSAAQKIQSSQQVVATIVDREEPVYGINTGFGPLCTTRINKEETRRLQTNILKSHSVGVGDPVSSEIARLMLVLKLHALAQGFSGVALETLQRIQWHLDEGIIPVVPSQGSVGASGDLAPLAHLFLPLIGLGEVEYEGEKQPTQQVLDRYNLSPLSLGPKEGLALINGTQFIAAHAVLLIERLQRALDHADLFGAMMLEGLQGSARPFMEALHQLRPYQANQHVATRIRNFLEGSEILEDHIDCERVQDPYSLRCMPQVHGASRTAWLHLKELVEIELNAVTDNPVVIDEDLTISGGNFHGQPLAMAIDYACLAASELGSIADRRIYLALEGNIGVPKLLMKDTGINSGYMMLQYTSAALASENKSLCFPSSADSIPTSLGQEDHVSMGSISGRKALQVVENLEKIQAVELLTAAQAFEFRKPLKSGPVLDAIHSALRETVSFAAEDRIFAEDIELGLQFIKSGKAIHIAQQILEQNGVNTSTPWSAQFDGY